MILLQLQIVLLCVGVRSEKPRPGVGEEQGKNPFRQKDLGLALRVIAKGS